MRPSNWDVHCVSLTRIDRLHCIGLNQIELINCSHHESQDLEYDSHQSGTILCGLSVGLVAAAAISISRHLSDVALNGVESVRVAFRLGVHVAHVSQFLESYEAGSTPESWAYVVTGVPLEVIREEIGRYNKESVSAAQSELRAFNPN